MRFLFGIIFLALFNMLMLVQPQAQACPFCSAQGQTLMGEYNTADFIVYGSMINQKRDPEDFTRGSSELVIEKTIKDHPFLKGRKTITIPKFVPNNDGKTDVKHLVFFQLYPPAGFFAASAIGSGLVVGNVHAYQIDPYHGLPIPLSSKLPEYLSKIQEMKDKEPVARLKFYFDYLESAELDISSDAFMEFGQADYKHVRAVAEKASVDKIMSWIKDPNTPSSRLGLYGMMLGHCGAGVDAKAIRDLIDEQARQFNSGLDGLTAGYVLLDPKSGWEYLQTLLKDPTKDFNTRYAALRVLRFFWEYRPDVISHAKVLEGMQILMADPKLGDMPVEDLRKWKQWEQTKLVLELAAKESHKKEPLFERAVIRYCLSAPQTTPGVKAYLDAQRKDNGDRVKEIEDLLALEEKALANK